MGICNENKDSAAKKRKINNDSIYPVNLLHTIKSKYIFIKISEILCEKKKLNIICYNKKIKKILGINLDDYKKISRKKFVGKRNGRGKEYKIDKNILIFEGKYLNG